MDFLNFRTLDAFERILIFEVSCPLLGISRQWFAQFAVNLRKATRQFGKTGLEFFRDVLILSHV